MNKVTGISELISAGFVAGALALFWHFVRSYFTRLHQDLSEIKGAVELMRRDLHDTREKLVNAGAEVKALWRTVDAPRRASDREPRGGTNGR